MNGEPEVAQGDVLWASPTGCAKLVLAFVGALFFGGVAVNFAGHNDDLSTVELIALWVMPFVLLLIVVGLYHWKNRAMCGIAKELLTIFWAVGLLSLPTVLALLVFLLIAS